MFQHSGGQHILSHRLCNPWIASVDTIASAGFDLYVYLEMSLASKLQYLCQQRYTLRLRPSARKMGSYVQIAQVCQVQIQHIALAVCQTFNGLIMKNHHMSITAHLHIYLNSINLQRTRVAEGSQGIF